MSFKHYCGLVEITVEGQYLSPVLEDMEEYTFSICERCLKKMFDNFAIKPESGGE